MLLGLPEELEERYRDVVKRVDLLVAASFEGARELELEALLQVLRGLGVRKARTLKLTERGVEAEEGIVIPPWRRKSLEGSLEEVSNAIMPIEVNGWLLWFQSYHPSGGSPDIMISFNDEVSWDGEVLSFGSPAWEVRREGSTFKAKGLDWEPDLLIEVKRSVKAARRYPAKVRVMACVNCKGALEGWVVSKIGNLSSLIASIRRAQSF